MLLPYFVLNFSLFLMEEENMTTTLKNFTQVSIPEIKAPETVSLVRILLGVFLALVSLAALLGNCLVIAAVATKTYLRNPTGYLIISMAVADLIVGVLVMPFAIMLEVRPEQTWELGLIFCDIWHCLDILASTASIWNLSVISMDRYVAITTPLNYWDKMTTLRTAACIASVWVTSLLISFPAIAWWRYSSPELYIDENRCVMPQSPAYVIPASVLAYYIPLALTLYAYGSIFLIALRAQYAHRQGKTRADKGLQMRVHRGGSVQVNGVKPLSKMRTISEDQTPEMVFENPANASPCSSKNQALPKEVQCIKEESVSENSPGRNTETFHNSLSDTPLLNRRHFPRLRPFHREASLPELKKGRQRFNNEKKAAKTLGVVVGCFLLCWLPFFVTNVLLTLCEDCVAEPALTMSAVTWLGYINSALNPLIYGCYSCQFRQAFKELLRCSESRTEMARNSAIRYAIQQSLFVSRVPCEQV